MAQTDDFWDFVVPERYQPGTLVRARVTRITRFGIVVELEPDVEGLVHISELADIPVRRIDEVVKVDDVIELMVLRVDVTERKIGLSRKRIAW